MLEQEKEPRLKAKYAKEKEMSPFDLVLEACKSAEV